MKKIFCQLIYKIILINFFFTFLFQFNSLQAAYKSLFTPDIPSEIFIKLGKKNMSLYADKIYGIFNDKVKIIHPRYKTYVSGKISFILKEKYVSHNVELRIVGDWHDHISKNEMISSLQIRIKDGNIGGIRKFRLYLLDAKKDSVLWSIIHEAYGFPTLYRKEVMVNFNNKKYVALFEETPEKEFLERWSIRESPIVEFDERQIWTDRYYKKDTDQVKEDIMEETTYFEDKSVSEFESPPLYRLLKTYKIDNATFIKNDLDNLITLKSLNIKKNSIIAKFDELNIEHGKHGLSPHNRKFIYDPIYNLHIPISFDSMVDIKNCKSNVLSRWKKTSDKNKT